MVDGATAQRCGVHHEHGLSRRQAGIALALAELPYCEWMLPGLATPGRLVLLSGAPQSYNRLFGGNHINVAR